MFDYLPADKGSDEVERNAAEGFKQLFKLKRQDQ